MSTPRTALQPQFWIGVACGVGVTAAVSFLGRKLARAATKTDTSALKEQKSEKTEKSEQKQQTEQKEQKEQKTELDLAPVQMGRQVSLRTAHIKPIHKIGHYHVVLNITGGGATAIGKLLSVPGASITVLQATVPYSNTALAHLINFTPAKAVTFEVAIALAKVGLEKAEVLVAAEERFSERGEPLGIGCTAKLDDERGSAFVSFHTAELKCALRWSKGDLVPPQADQQQSKCEGAPSLLSLPYKRIVGSRADQEEALAHNMIVVLSELSLLATTGQGLAATS